MSEPQRRRRRWRRLLLWAGIPLGLVIATYFARRPLFERWIARRVGTELAGALGVEARVGSIGGSWLTDVIVSDIELHGAENSAYRTLTGLSLHLDFSPWSLALGDLGGARQLRCSAKRLTLDLGKSWSVDQPTTSGEGGTAVTLAELLRLFPRGATIDVGQLTLIPECTRPAAARLVLEPGSGSRTARLDYGDNHLTAEVSTSGAYRVRVTGSEAGRILRTLGVARGAPDAGRLEVVYHGDTGSDTMHLEVDLAAKLASGRDAGIQATANWRKGHVRAPRFEVDLPGIKVEGREFDVPLAALIAGSTARLQQDTRGSLRVEVTDLESYRALLPAPVLPLLPVTATLGIDVAQGVATLQRSTLRGRGFEIALEAGSFALVAAPAPGGQLVAALRGARAQGITVRVGLTPEFRLPLIDGAELRAQGSIAVRAAGTLTQPGVAAACRLRALEYRAFRCPELDADLTFDGAVVEARSLRVRALRRTSDAAGIDATGSTSVSLDSTGQLERASWTVQSDLGPELLRAFGIDPKHLAVGALQVRGSWTANPAVLGVQVHAPSTRIGQATGLDLSAAGKIEGGSYAVERCELRGKDVSLAVAGTVAADGRFVDLRSHADIARLGPLLASLPSFGAAGRMTLRDLHVRSTRGAPELEVDGEVTLDDFDRAKLGKLCRERGWLKPAQFDQLPVAPFSLRVRGASGATGIDLAAFALVWGSGDRRIALDATGPLPLRHVPGALEPISRQRPLELRLDLSATPLAGRPPVRGQVKARVDAAAVVFDALEVRSTGTLSGSGLRIGARTSAILGKDPLSGSTLAGRLVLRDFDLADLQTWLPAGMALRGRAQGELDLDGTLGRPALRGGIELTDGGIRYPRVPEVGAVNLSAKFTQSRAEVRCRARQSAQEMACTAWFDRGDTPLWSRKDGPVQGALDVSALPLNWLPQAWTGLAGLRGTASIRGTLTGSALQPRPDVRIEIRDAGGGGQDLKVEGLVAEARVQWNRAELLRAEALVLGLPVRVSAHLQTDAPLWALAKQDTARLDGALQLSDFPLRLLPRRLTGLADIDGVLSGSLKLGGTPREPVPELSVTLRKGTLKTLGIPRLADLTVEVRADERLCSVTGSATMGAAPVRLKGTLAPGKGPLAVRWKDGLADFSLRGERVLLLRHGGLKVRSDVDLRATGKPERLEIGGKITVDKNSRFLRRLSLVPDLKVKGGGSAGDVFGPWKIAGAERMTFDVQIVTREAIEVRTNVLDTSLDVSCRLRGQGSALVLQGVCSSQSGTVRFPGMGLKVQSLRMMFEEANPTRPKVIGVASGERHGIRIQMRVSGPWDDPVVALTSTPALQPRELWSLVTTGLRPQSLAQNSSQSNTALLATYVLQELLLTYIATESTEASESFVSRFTFEFGREISRGGQETWQVDFDVGKLWIMPPHYGLRLERDVYEDINLGIVYRWRF
ncbi:MAG: translocation/assembly module TamB domain-containing protein [Planctomycetes bacterium]|nr:translocation/assembly module TamB domain-containing protein [Planctomycetota bacterium]MCB9889073.1 translocation/assembly module TamB domain-containing protein [Planctomycetota bacterium]